MNNDETFQKPSGWLRYLPTVLSAMIVGVGIAWAASQTNYLGTVFIADPTTPTRQMTINADGSINTSGSVSLTNPTIGAAVPATANYIAGNQSGLLAGITIDLSGNVNVNCASGCGSTSDASITGSQTSATTLVSATDASGFQSVSFNFTSVGSGNVVKVQQNNDNGGTWFDVPISNTSAGSAAPTNGISPATATTYTAPVRMRYVRLQITTYSSGTVTVQGTFKGGSFENFITLGTGSNVIGALAANQTVAQSVAANFLATVTQGPSAALGSGWAIKGDEVADTTGTFTNGTQTTSITASNLDGYDTGLVTITGTYGTATAVFEGSDDGGTTWFAVQAARSDGTATELGYTTLTNTTRAWIMPINGFDALRVRSTAVASGTVNVRISVMSQPTAAASMNSLSGFGVGVDTNNGTTSAFTQRVTLSSDSTGQVKLATGANTIGALTANQSVNVAQMNGVATTMGNGVSGTGVQRVVLASDGTSNTNPWFVNGNVTPADAKALGTTSIGTYSYQGLYNGTTIDLQREVVNAQNTTGTGIAAAGILGQLDDASVGTCTENQFCPLRLDANRSLDTNLLDIGGAAILTGNGVTGTGSPRVTIASDNTTLSNTFGNVGEVPLTTGGLSSYVAEPGASDNHAVIKTTAGQVYGVFVTTKHTAAQYIRLYNATTGFNGCNSATNIMFEGVVPAASTGAGFALPVPPGLAFSTGIAICFTGAFGNTDTTNATASVTAVNVFYK